MNRWARFFSHRKRMMKDLDQDIHDFIERETQDNIDRGMPPEEARYAALRKFGNIVSIKEDAREVWTFGWLEQLWQDIRYGLRMLRKNPGFTAVAVLTLALGIGANTAIFSVVNAVVLHPLAYPHSDRLVWICEVLPALEAELATGADYVDWKYENHTLDQIAAYDEDGDFNLTGHGTPMRVHGVYATANLFATLGVEPQLGRSFTPNEDQPNGSRLAILMHPFWQQYFGSDPHVLGQTIDLDSTPTTIVGVMPDTFRFPGDAGVQLLVPMQLNEPEERLRSGRQRIVSIVGRMKPGVTLAAARTDLDEIRTHAKAMSPGAPRGASGPAGPAGARGPASASPSGGGSMLRTSAQGPPPAAPNGRGNVFLSPGGAPPAGKVPLGPRGPEQAASPDGMHRIGDLGGAPMQAGAPAAGPLGAPGPAQQARMQDRPSAPPQVELKVIPLAEHLAGNLRPAMLTLMGVVGLVLLIACANVANLMLTRASARSREVAVRAVLGAGRWRLVRQLLAESVSLALLGGVAGLLLATWGVAVMARLIPPDLGGGILGVAHPHVDGTVLLFVLGVSLLTGILFGLAPAIAVIRSDLAEGLKEAAPVASAGAQRGWLRGALAVAEISLALVLLIGAGLLIKSFYRLVSVDLGFAPERVLTMDLSVTDSRYPTDQQKTEFFSDVLRRVVSLPGVRSAGLSDSLPLSPYRNRTMLSMQRLTGRAVLADSTPVMIYRITVSPGYFYTLGIPVLQGRTFTDHDDEKSQRVAVVNEALARHIWPGENPIGKQLPLAPVTASTMPLSGAGSNGPQPTTIVGVVGNTRHEGLSQDIEGEIYLPYFQETDPSMQLALRTATEPTTMVRAVRSQVMAVDSSEPIYRVSTMEQTLSDSLAPRRFNMLLLGMFAGLALALATVGIYGVIAFSVTQRTHEIGIRMALGAERPKVLGLIVRQGLRLTLIGVALGVAGAWTLTGFLARFLFGVAPRDPATFALVSLALVAVSILACYIPARRATRVDPIVALRYE